MKLRTFVLVLVVAGVVGWYLAAHIDDFFPASEPQLKSVAQTAETPAEPAAERLPVPPRHPVAPLAAPTVVTEPQPVELPFPSRLEESDAFLKHQFPQIPENQKLWALLDLDNFIPKLVLFVDHLPEANIPRLHLPFIPPEPGFVTSGSGELRTIGKANMLRYLNYVKLVEVLPDATLLRLYRGLYPLFQQAYREAGHERGYFNDRLIEVFDDLLQTPEPQGPIEVVRHIGRFRFVDPDLEARSAGQKILLRMGVESTRRVKQKLLGLRQALAN